MIKTHWVKTAVVCGTALTLALAAGSVRVDTNAATMCKETEMAGLSLSLDKHYADVYNEEEQEENIDATEAGSDCVTCSNTGSCDTCSDNSTNGNAGTDTTCYKTVCRYSDLHCR